jgi:hypothetical protein
VVRTAQPIQGGAVDTGDPAVVGIVINTGGGIAICTGALIAPNLVLTAHHCVSQTPSSSSGCSTSSFGAQYATSAFRVTSSYNAAANAFGTGSIPTVDSKNWFGAAKVTVAGGNICGQDMAVIELSKPMTGICPLVPRVDSAVGSGEGYTAVGFGITSPTAAAAGTRYKVAGLSVQCASSCGGGTSSTLEWIGGSSAAKGTCEGDSGGPALDSAGRVLGTVSRGPAASCNQTVYEGTFGEGAWIKQMAQQAATDGGYAAAGWITGGATSDPNNGYCGSGTGGGTADTGAGGGSTDAGGGTADTGAGGGSTSGTCADPSASCLDATGAGDYGCFAAGPSFPTSAKTCAKQADCSTGYSCWAASAGATSGSCIQDCSATGGGGTADTGSGSGGGTSSGACSDPSLTCYAFGDGSMACVDGSSSSGIPAGAPTCDGTTACPTGHQCYAATGAASGTCLQVCSGATTGGADTGTASGGGSGSADAGSGVGGGAGGGTGGGADAGSGGLGGLGVVDSGTDGGHKTLLDSDTGAAGSCSVVERVGGDGASGAGLVVPALALAMAALARRRRH